MTFLRPCQHCPVRTDCDFRASKLAAIRGAKLTLISFRCDKKRALFPNGARVALAVIERFFDGRDGFEERERRITATVLRPSRKMNKLLIQSDDPVMDDDSGEGKFRRLLTVWPDRLTREEGDRPLCECGFATAANGQDCDLPPTMNCWAAARDDEAERRNMGA